MIISLSGKIGSGKDTVARIIQVLEFLDRHNRSGGDNDQIINPNNWTWEKILKEKHEPFGSIWEIKKFAFKLKQIVSILTGIKTEDLEKQEVKELVLPPCWDWIYHDSGARQSVLPTMEDRSKKYSVRELLQRVGTEAMRDQIHMNVWVNALFSEYKCACDNCRSSECDQMPNWIITDTRFPNEAQAVKEHGGFLVRVNRLSSNNSGNHPSETALDNYDGYDYVIDNNGTIDELVDKVKEMMGVYESKQIKQLN